MTLQGKLNKKRKKPLKSVNKSCIPSPSWSCFIIYIEESEAFAASDSSFYFNS